MRNFNNNNSFGSSRGGGGGFNRDRNSRGFGGGGSSNQMYDATCAECGNSCQVPFMPRNGKPVYCSNCFESRDNNGGGDRPSRQRDSFPRPQFQERRAPGLSYNPERENKKLDLINEKLDQILKLLKTQKSSVAAPNIKVAQMSEPTPAPTVEEAETEILTPNEE